MSSRSKPAPCFPEAAGGAGNSPLDQGPAQSAPADLRPPPAAPSICPCTEPAAHGEDWPDNMHTHEGCRVYHRFKDCAAGQGVLPL